MKNVLKFRNFKEIPPRPMEMGEINDLIADTGKFNDSPEFVEDFEIDYHEARLDYLLLCLRNHLSEPPKRARTPKVKGVK